MRPTLLRYSFCLIALPLLALPVMAQTWDALHSLEPGARIQVLTTGHAEFRGRFQSVAADAISLATVHGVATVERTRVLQVKLRSTAHRVRRIAIAAAIGIAAGAVADQTLGAYFRNESGESGGARAATYIAPAAIFAGTAGAFPAYRTVYRIR
jgi:hypothetical protein